MNECKIRQYKKSDKEEIIQLFFEFGNYLKDLDDKSLGLLIFLDDYGRRFYNKMVEEIKKTDGIIYVLEKDDHIIGFVSGIVKSVGKDPGDDCKVHITGRLTELFVTQQYRGKGYGTKLINKMFEYFKNKNCYKVNVEVFAPNQNAYKFYKHLGFSERNYDLVKIL